MQKPGSKKKHIAFNKEDLADQIREEDVDNLMIIISKTPTKSSKTFKSQRRDRTGVPSKRAQAKSSLNREILDAQEEYEANRDYFDSYVPRRDTKPQKLSVVRPELLEELSKPRSGSFRSPPSHENAANDSEGEESDGAAYERTRASSVGSPRTREPLPPLPLTPQEVREGARFFPAKTMPGLTSIKEGKSYKSKYSEQAVVEDSIGWVPAHQYQQQQHQQQQQQQRRQRSGTQQRERTETIGPSSSTSFKRTAGAQVGGSFAGRFNHDEQTIQRQAYGKFKERALASRQRLGIGRSRDMSNLFRFWSFFLREHFNRNIYLEFKNLAIEDHRGGSRYGVECLFRFYSYGLEQRYRFDLYNDFQDMVLWDCEQDHLYGLEKLWALLRYSKDHRYPGQLRRELKEKLAPFKTVDDFRVHASASPLKRRHRSRMETSAARE